MKISDSEIKTKEAKGESKKPHPTRAEMIELNERRLKGDPKARQEMIDRNDGLVFKIVNQQKNQWDPDYKDCLQAGMEGLMRAVDGFDPSKGAFSTYAYIWIRQKLDRRHKNDDRTIRLPVHFQTDMNKLRRIKDRMEQKLEREPTVEEISAECGLSKEKIRNFVFHLLDTASLDKPMKEDGEDWYEVVPSPLNPQPDIVVSAIDASEDALRQIHDLCDHLEKSFSPRDKQIFFTRYGLFSGSEPKTLKEVGDLFGMTRERVRQICDDILRRRRKLKLPISSQEELRQVVECLHTGLEAKFAHTNKMCPEIMKVLGGFNGNNNASK